MSTGLQPVLNAVASNNGDIELCMPHGCCHLFCESVKADALGVSFSGMNVSTNGPVVSINNHTQFLHRIQTDAFPPVMSYFEPTKRTTSGANLIDDQRKRWRQLSASATTIAIVGVHPRMHDSHIWEPLSSTSAQLIYCGGPAGEIAFDSRRHSVGRTKSTDTILRGYFAEEFNNLCTSVGL